MIATHSIKSLNSRMKQTAIRANIIGDTHGFFSSQLLPFKTFAAPSNAADIGTVRLDVEQVNADKMTLDELGTVLPDIEDGRIKQVLVPYQSDYVAITPVPSLAMIEAVSKAHLVAYLPQVIQPVLAACSNHGDPVANMRGRVKLIHNAPYGSIKDVVLKQPVLLITGQCVDMNVSSCYVSTGLPALTSVGGFVHVLERDTGLSLPFTFGIKDIGGLQKYKKSTNNSRTATNAQKTIPQLLSDEVTTNANIAFILKVENESDAQKVIESAKHMNRFAGGMLFNVEATYTEYLPAYYWYEQYDSSRLDFEEYLDSQHLGTKLIQSGFALLETPVKRDKARGKIHAWGEPVFSLFLMSQVPSHLYTLSNRDNVLVWECNNDFI